MREIIVVSFQKKVKDKEHYGELETSFADLLPLVKTCFNSGYKDLRVELREMPEIVEDKECQETEL